MNYNSRDFGRVAVLMGGLSAEREVSLMSGTAVLNALLAKGVDAFAIDVGLDICQRLSNEKIDRVFNILHGPGGEDGCIQGVLETLNIPYTGSGVLASALAMDKIVTKQIWRSLNLPTLDFLVYEPTMTYDEIIARLGLPIAVKPVHQGSTLGVSKVERIEHMAKAIEKALSFKDTVMIEPWIDGKELTVSVVGKKTLPIVHIESAQGFYDYEAKYFSEETKYHCPSDLPVSLEEDIKKTSLEAYKALGCRHWGRIDLILDQNQQYWLLEANTVPGMTSHSLVPTAARSVGIDFETLVLEILAMTFTDD